MNNYSKSKYTQFFVTTFSLLVVSLFGLWWFHPSHIPHNFDSPRILDILLFILVSYVIWHPIIMEVLTWFIALRIQDVPRLKPTPGLKVAFITTIVPKNEPLDLLHKCLPAMVRAKYPHDTWLLDESNSEEVKAICHLYGVKHFSRAGSRRYNMQEGKYAVKTKGGNHNSWYNEYGNAYDIVAQIDTDFVPKSTFLTETLGQFRDPYVAFVGTPQIYGNTKSSLIALGAAEQQYSFYGAVLRGLSGMGMTLLIGANHVIRVAAFKEVNHYTAHITEDLITGIKLHAKGWKSVYVPYPLAVGEGPATWEAYFNQQLRWAYGCIDILFRHTPRHLPRMGLFKGFYYFFLQQHYFTGLAMALSTLLLGLYFGFGIRAADVDTLQFFLIYSFALLVSWLMSVWLQRYHVQPQKDGEFLLAGKIIGIAAWPIWFLGFISVIMGKRLTYKITPKGEHNTAPSTSPSVFIPHMLFGASAAACLISSVFTGRQSPVMLFWAASSTIIMLGIPFVLAISPLVEKGKHIVQKMLRKITRTVIEEQPAFLHPWSRSQTYPRYSTGVMEDSIFLSFTVWLSCIPYIGKLGFYTDDWSFLGNFTVSKDQSLWGLIQTATTPNTMMRPLQNIYDAILFSLFGLNPVGYQLVNMGVFIAAIIMFYLCLRKVKIPRIIALTIPLVYALLPNYSADRFWYAVFQANLSMLFFFTSLYAGIQAFSSETFHTFAWKITSIGALILTALSYEVVLPLTFINAGFFLLASRIRSTHSAFLIYSKRNPLLFIFIMFLLLGYVFTFKAITTTRLETLPFPYYHINLISSAFSVNYGTWGLALISIWGEILSRYATPWTLAGGFLMYTIVFIYLESVTANKQFPLPKASWLRNLLLASPVIFLLGYLIFFTNNQVGFSPTGIENRVAIAASIGVACTFVALFGLTGRLLPKVGRIVFCILIALVCAGNTMTITTLSTFWEKAYQKQIVYLQKIQEAFPTFPHNSTLILDGICPYVGPAPVFEAEWDLKGALQIIYNDKTLRADIVSPRLKVVTSGLNTQIYTFPASYSYKNLFIYNAMYNKSFRITNVQEAQAYFAQYNPTYHSDCPQATAGKGVQVFESQ